MVYLVPSAVGATSGRPKLRYAFVVDQAPQLRANLVHFRANAHRFVGGVKLQATLQVGIIHGASR